MANIKFTKNGNELLPKITPSDIFDKTGVSLEKRLDNLGVITPILKSGVKIAEVNGVSLYAPNSNGSSAEGSQTAIYFENITELTNSATLSVGDVVITKGFYCQNDGGGSTFYVISGDDVEDEYKDGDGCTLIKLANGLYADIAEPVDGIMNFRQFGARMLMIRYYDDCKPYMEKYMDFCDRKCTTIRLFIPNGVWVFSETLLVRKKYPEMGVSIFGENMEGCITPGVAVIASMPQNTGSSTQKYIFKFGDVIDGNTYESAGNSVTNLRFGGDATAISTFQNGGYSQQLVGSYYGLLGSSENKTYDAPKFITEGMFVVTNTHDNRFDSLYFMNCSTCLRVGNTYNNYFGFINPRCSGKFYGTKLCYPIVFEDNVSTTYFDYFNFEASKGYFFGEADPDTPNPVQFTINNIQAECTHPNDGTAPTAISEVDEIVSILDGKLGDAERPVIIQSISISNLSNFFTDSNGKMYKAMSLIGNGNQGIAFKSSIILGQVFCKLSDKYTDDAISDLSFFIFDTMPGSKFCINQVCDTEDYVLYLRDASMPLVNTTHIRTSNNIVPAYQANPSKVSTKKGALSPFYACGANERDEKYEFISTKSDISVRIYQTSTQVVTPVIEKQVNGVWVTVTTSPITVEGSGWVTFDLPSINITYPTKVRISGLPKYVDIFLLN